MDACCNLSGRTALTQKLHELPSVRLRSDSHDSIHQSVEHSLGRLMSLWQEIGIDGEMQSERYINVRKRVDTVMEEMIAEEMQRRQQIINNIASYQASVDKISAELGQTSAAKLTGNLTLLEQEKTLVDQLRELYDTRDDMLLKLKNLKDKEDQLCDVLSEKPSDVDVTAVPSTNQLAELQENVLRLECEKTSRFAVYEKTKQAIVQLTDELEVPPCTHFELVVVNGSVKTFKPSTGNMKLLQHYHQELEEKKKSSEKKFTQLRGEIETLWLRLNISHADVTVLLTSTQGYKAHCIHALEAELRRCRELQRQNLRQVIDAARQDVERLWHQCYISREERPAFSDTSSAEYTEEVLSRYEEELKALRNYYDTNKVAERDELFQKFLAFEKSANDRERLLSNRGCRVMAEEKGRQRLMKSLPKLQQQLKQYIASVEAQSGRKITVNGLSCDVYVRRQCDEYNNQKETEKREREETKRQQLHNEMMFGSHPAPVLTRKRHVTPPPFMSPASIARRKHRKPDETQTIVTQNRVKSSMTRNLQATNRRLQMPSARRRPLAPRQQDREQYVVVNYVPSSTVTATDTTVVTNTTITQQDNALNEKQRTNSRSSARPTDAEHD